MAPRLTRVLIAALVCSLGGCSPPEPPQPTFEIGVPGRTAHLDPARGDDAGSIVIGRFAFQTLPELATQVRTTGRTWRFALPRGRRFADGALLDAAAVAANFARWRSGGSGPNAFVAYGRTFAGPASLERVVATDSTHVEIRTRFAFPRLLAVLGNARFGLASPRALGGGDAAFDALPVGSGSYRVTRWQPGEYVLLEPVPARVRPPLASVIVRDVPDPRTALLSLQKADLSVVYDFPFDYLRDARTSELHPIREVATGRYCAFAFNLRASLRMCPPSASARGYGVETFPP